jgi:hypothetical protein
MYAPLNHIKRTAGLPATFLLLLLIAGLSCPAQNRTRLPDSIPGSVENTPPIVDTAATTIDTVRVAGTETGRQEDKTTTTNLNDSSTFRTVPDSVITRLKKDRDFAYASDPAYWTPKKEDKEEPRFLRFLEQQLSSRGFKYFIYLLLAGILFYALYKIIAENNLRLFYRTGAKGTTDNGQGPGLAEEDLDEGLTKAMAAQDHRLATRYLYLKALRLLDAKGLIRYHPQATNQEYISQLNMLPQGEAFRFLTGAYERAWYGDFAINERQFESLLRYFQDFYKSIPSR